MIWNAVVMLIASLGVLWGLREGVRYTLLTELDDDLQDDFGEISLALVNVFEADSRFLHAGMDRKARGHKQRSWFLQIVDMRPPEVREEQRLREEQWRREERNRFRSGRPRPFPPPEIPPPGSINGSPAPVVPTEAEIARSDLAQNLPASASTAASSPASDPGPESTKTADDGPRIIWQTFNVPDWSMLKVPANFDKFVLPDGVATTIDYYRILEQTVHNARGGPVRVRIGASIRSIQHSAETTDKLMLLNILVALVIAPLGGYWLALRATRPLSAMIRTTDRLRPQEMSERLPITHTEDEIDQLSRAFNRLLDRIAEYLTKRQDLLANSAHELRTPLAALRSTAELALSSDRTVEEYCELLESIVSECGNLEQLVNQLLLLSETESAHFDSRGETVDFSTITAEACDMFGAVAESRGVTLTTDVAPGILVDGSRLHLRQLLNNLIDNAIKFIPGDGQVSVQLASLPSGQCLTVCDTGVGIALEEQKHLFERFYRGDKARRRNTPTRGTGLGLSICRAIAEAHGGTISVQSEPGVGTQVSVILPQHRESKHAPTAPPANPLTSTSTR
ncbi:MAG: HAMP domain-containing histidine kinase [Pirellulaceae bacterium]|nr:HAMP domain-containing histidine kinase [Pirellulaceae bacterium]